MLLLPSFYGLNRLTELRDIAFDLRGPQAEAVDDIQEVRLALDGVDRFARSYIAFPDSNGCVPSSSASPAMSSRHPST